MFVGWFVAGRRHAAAASGGRAAAAVAEGSTETAAAGINIPAAVRGGGAGSGRGRGHASGRVPSGGAQARPRSRITRAMVAPICAGELVTCTPAASSARILSCAVPLPPGGAAGVGGQGDGEVVGGGSAGAGT